MGAANLPVAYHNGAKIWDRDGAIPLSEYSIDLSRYRNHRIFSYLSKYIRSSNLIYSICCGLIFILIFQVAYSYIPNEYYQVRDDGVITLSHAKNLVDYGFIGLGPSGGRVEGFSAPTQFFAYAILYGLTGVSYGLFAGIQTVTCTFLLGFVFSRFFQADKMIGFVAAFAVSLVAVGQTSFLEWHGSGMENAITHVLFLSTFYLLFKAAESGNVSYGWSIIVFLASISRLESVFHLAPLLVIFSIHGVIAHKEYRAFKFSALVFVLWASFHVWRYWYFGDILPNTAYAQDISIIRNLRDLVSFDAGVLTESLWNSFLIILHHGGLLLAPLAYLAFVKDTGRSVGFLVAITASLVATSLLNPLVFGPTRLDLTRSTTQLAVVIATMIPVIVYVAERHHRRLWRVPALGVASLLLLIPLRIDPYEVCCPIDGFDTVRATFDAAGREERLPRPTVANPDLGIMSWGKQFNIVDLGWLGSPIMAKLRDETALSDYFFEYAAPDLIESHGIWTCRYAESIFADPRFAENYTPLGNAVAPVMACADGQDPPMGFWIRRDILAASGSAERRLVDDLQGELSVDRLQHALDLCQRQEERHCTYVARTAYRFLPEFIGSGRHDELVALFRNSRSREFDLYLINGWKDGQAHMAAIDHIMNRHAGDTGDAM